MVPAVTSPDPASASSSSPDASRLRWPRCPSPPTPGPTRRARARPTGTIDCSAEKSAGSSALPNSWAAPHPRRASRRGRGGVDPRADAHVADRGPSTACTDAGLGERGRPHVRLDRDRRDRPERVDDRRRVQATDTWLEARGRDRAPGSATPTAAGAASAVSSRQRCSIDASNPSESRASRFSIRSGPADRAIGPDERERRLGPPTSIPIAAGLTVRGLPRRRLAEAGRATLKVNLRDPLGLVGEHVRAPAGT